MCIKLGINQGYTTMHVQPIIKTKWVFWFYLRILSGTFLILRRSERDIIINVLLSSCKILVRFQWDLKFLDRFSKKYPNIKIPKFLPVGAKLFHANGRTDMAKLRSAVLNSGNAPNNDRNWYNSKLLLKPFRRMIQCSLSTCKPV